MRKKQKTQYKFNIRPMIRNWVFRCDSCHKLRIFGEGTICLWCIADILEKKHGNHKSKGVSNAHR